MNTPKMFAKIGSVYMEEAILAVLEGEEGLRPEEISERLGIPTETDGTLRLANAVVLGFLTKLKLEGRVQDTDEPPNVARRWSLPGVPSENSRVKTSNERTSKELTEDEEAKRASLEEAERLASLL